MKILHVAEVVRGGISTFFNTFGAVCGPEEGIENRFVIPAEQADQMAPELSLITFPRRDRGPRAVAAVSGAAHAAAQAFRPDVLWFHSSLSLGPMAWLRARRVPGRYLYTAHGWAQLRETGLRRSLVAGLERQLAQLPDLIVNISGNDQALAQSSGYGRRHVLIENALPDLAAWPDERPFETGPERINLLFVGRFEKQKGLDLLFEAFFEAATRNPRLHLHVVGSGTQGVEEAGGRMPDRITLHPWMAPSRIAAFYRIADLVVMPSRWEGLPMVLIEALRAGTPVMVSDAAGLPGLIEPGRSGLVMPLAPAGMAAALAALDGEGIAAMRGAARDLYERRYSAPRFRAEVRGALQAP